MCTIFKIHILMLVITNTISRPTNNTFDCREHYIKCFNITDKMTKIFTNQTYANAELYNGIKCNVDYTLCTCTYCRYNIEQNLNKSVQFCSEMNVQNQNMSIMNIICEIFNPFSLNKHIIWKSHDLIIFAYMFILFLFTCMAFTLTLLTIAIVCNCMHIFFTTKREIIKEYYTYTINMSTDIGVNNIQVTIKDKSYLLFTETFKNKLKDVFRNKELEIIYPLSSLILIMLYAVLCLIKFVMYTNVYGTNFKNKYF